MRVFRWRDFCASVNDNNIIDNWVYHCILYDGSFPRRRLWLPSSPLPLLLLPVHCMVVSVRVWACERLSMGIEKPTCDYSLWQNQFGTHALHSILFSVFCLMHHHSPLTHSIHPPPPHPPHAVSLCANVWIFSGRQSNRNINYTCTTECIAFVIRHSAQVECLLDIVHILLQKNTTHKNANFTPPPNI